MPRRVSHGPRVSPDSAETFLKSARRMRRIVTPIPPPASIPRLEQLRKHEPTSMGGQPPDHLARGERLLPSAIPYGNQWIDFSAGVLVASMGYGHPRVLEAMRRQLETGLYHTYCFANEPRIDLVEKLAALAPAAAGEGVPAVDGFRGDRVRDEARVHVRAPRRDGPRRTAFRHLRERLPRPDPRRPACGRLAGSEGLDPRHAPRVRPGPVPRRIPHHRHLVRRCSSGSLEQRGVAPDSVCGVMTETYQGCNAQMFPVEYARQTAPVVRRPRRAPDLR